MSAVAPPLRHDASVTPASASPAPLRAPGVARARFRRLFGPLHVTGIFWVRVVASIAQLPYPLARPAVWFSAAFMFPLLPGRRRIVTTNLEGPLGECGFWTRQVRALRMFTAHAWHLYERFRALRSDAPKPHYTVEGDEIFKRLRSSGRGFVIVSAHFGNWELGPVLPLLEGDDTRRIHVVREREEHEDTQRFFEGRLAEVTGGRAVVHYLDTSKNLGVTLLQALRRGDVITLAGDRPRDPTQGIEVEMFGRRVLAPNGPAALARAARVPILPVFLWQERPGHQRLVAREAIEVPRTDDKAGDLRVAAQRVVDEVEATIRLAPFEWCRWEVVWLDD